MGSTKAPYLFQVGGGGKLLVLNEEMKPRLGTMESPELRIPRLRIIFEPPG
jgi:hypothetical protein